MSLIKIVMVVVILLVATVAGLALMGNGQAQQAQDCVVNAVTHAIASCNQK